MTFRVARYPNEILGQKIKKLRLEKGMKQVDLAKVLGENEDTVRNWEKGRTVPERGPLGRIDLFYGTKLEPEGPRRTRDI